MFDALIVAAIIGVVVVASLMKLLLGTNSRPPDGTDWEGRWSVVEFTERISEQPAVNPKYSSKVPVLASWTMLDESRCLYTVNMNYMDGAIAMASREGDEVRVEVRVKPWRVLILIPFGIFLAAVTLDALRIRSDIAQLAVTAGCGLLLALPLMALGWLSMTVWWTRFFRLGCQEIIRFQWSASAPDGGAP